MRRRIHDSSAQGGNTKKLSVRTLFSFVLVSGVSFYVGTITTYHVSSHAYSTLQKDYELEKREMESRHKRELDNLSANCKKDLDQVKNQDNGIKAPALLPSVSQNLPYFNSNFAKGMATMDREAFFSKFDFGSPQASGSDPFIIYHYDKSIPDNLSNVTQYARKDGLVPLDLDIATKNCDELNVVTIPTRYNRMCTVLVQNYENYLMQKWMRRKETGGAMDSKEDLRYVNRGMTDRGNRSHRPPSEDSIQKNWSALKTYFENFDAVVKELKPILEKVAKDNTIIVLTCNKGQSELLMNFVCNAKAKGLDVENVLVFPTDKETKDLAEGLGLTTYHDERNFGELPSSEARSYGDRKFVAMMFAKVVCVQIVNYLGYDLLFQDVDVIWYKNPLEWFHDKNNPYHGFDMYFQDDGAHSVRYAPYSANSGFYFVRSNELTKYFFTSLLYHNDEILSSTSHQQALIQLMADHSSKYGTRVKVLDREMMEFPGGWHYHNRPKRSFMKAIMSGEVVPYIFHMSWTKNKDNKIKFYQQMGEWYLADQCISHTKEEIFQVAGISDEGATLFEPCCLAEPNIVCHYRDKPSKIPCKDVPPIDNGARSFW